MFGGAPAQLKVVRAGRVIVLPLVHKLGRLHLSARQINVSLPDAVTKQGIKVAVQGVATVKIGGDDESIRNAAERFQDRDEQIEPIVKNVLEGSLRSIVGTLTVEELNYDRQKFQQEVQGAAKADLATSGLTIDNFTIQAIRDEVGYMDLIGQQETARRERDARMAKAQADQEAAVREAEAQQIKLNAQRDVSLRQAEVEALTAAAEAKAAQAGPLAQAEAQQEVVRRQTELAQLEADRTPEGAHREHRPPRRGRGRRPRSGGPRATSGPGSPRPRPTRSGSSSPARPRPPSRSPRARRRRASPRSTPRPIAKQTTLEGNAEAGIVFTKGEAEAKALALRADAYRQFNEAAIISTVLSMLPEIVRAAAEPMSHIDNLTVLSSDGASEVVKNATRTIAEASATVKGLTGIDIPQLLNNAVGRSDAKPPEPSGPELARDRARDGGDERPGGGEGSGGGGDPGTGPGPKPKAPAGGAASTSGEDASASSEPSASAARRRFVPDTRAAPRCGGSPGGRGAAASSGDAAGRRAGRADLAAAADAHGERPRPGRPAAARACRARGRGPRRVGHARRGGDPARGRAGPGPGHRAVRGHAPPRPRPERPADARVLWGAVRDELDDPLRGRHDRHAARRVPAAAAAGSAAGAGALGTDRRTARRGGRRPVRDAALAEDGCRHLLRPARTSPARSGPRRRSSTQSPLASIRLT